MKADSRVDCPSPTALSRAQISNIGLAVNYAPLTDFFDFIQVNCSLDEASRECQVLSGNLHFRSPDCLPLLPIGSFCHTAILFMALSSRDLKSTNGILCQVQENVLSECSAQEIRCWLLSILLILSVARQRAGASAKENRKPSGLQGFFLWAQD